MMIAAQQQQEMLAAQQQQEMMAAQQQGAFGQVPPPGSMEGTAAGPSGRLFQQAAAGAGLGAQAQAGGMTLDEDDMDL